MYAQALTYRAYCYLQLLQFYSPRWCDLNLAPHPYNEMCRVILSTVTHRKPEDVELCYTSDVSDDFQIVTDEQRMQQVLINLLTNAEKHTEKGKMDKTYTGGARFLLILPLNNPSY